MTTQIKKVLVYLSNGEVKRVKPIDNNRAEAFYKEEILESNEGPVLLVDCFFAGASVTDVTPGK